MEFVSPINQKDKKCEFIVFRVMIESKTRVGVIVGFYLEMWNWKVVTSEKGLRLCRSKI